MNEVQQSARDAAKGEVIDPQGDKREADKIAAQQRSDRKAMEKHADKIAQGWPFVLTSLVIETYDHGAKSGIAWRFSDGALNSLRLDGIFAPEVVQTLKVALDYYIKTKATT